MDIPADNVWVPVTSFVELSIRSLRFRRENAWRITKMSESPVVGLRGKIVMSICRWRT